MTPGDVKVYGLDQMEDAKRWVAACTTTIRRVITLCITT
jgi:hypothetical protein